MRHTSSKLRNFTTTFLLIALLATTVPMTTFAEEAGDGGAQGTETSTGSEGDQTENAGAGEDTGAGTDGGDGQAGSTDGEAGDAGGDATEDGDEGSVIEVEAVNDVQTQPEGAEGEEGTTGDDGDDGSEEDDGTDGAEVTGGQQQQGTTTTTVITGDATATGTITTDANNTNIANNATSTTADDDFDTYTFNATGTNEALVDNQATTTAVSGENAATSTNDNALIRTGEAVATLNIANIVNTNVVNSKGLIKLLNVLLEAGQSFDLRDIFSWDTDMLAAACTLMSCLAEDVEYNVLQDNLAEIANRADLDAISGANTASGETATVETGDAYASANVLNVANTNIIDSNYMLLALNLLGSLDGDLILPTADLFTKFFAQPNGMSRLEQQHEDFTLNDTNVNNATTTNNILANAEAGLNQATTTNDAVIKTGQANAESNIVNEINKNLFGGDSMYMLIRVHGSWNGNVYGLPDGITWTRTDDGILIYNENAEIAPSQIIAYDIDSYTANLNNQNDVIIDNDLTLDALSGGNSVEAATGTIKTGNAYAGANVMNVANTNVIGRNWVMATMNIFGDFAGDISFGQPDLWIGGQVKAASTPVGPGTKLTFTYTITNNGDLKADDVTFTQDLESAYTIFGVGGTETRDTTRTESLGTVRPGQTITVSYDAYVNDDLPYGTTDVRARARIGSDEPDGDDGDNEETLSIVAEHQQPAPSGGGGSSSGGGGSSSGGGGGSSSGGGGGGGGTTSGKVLGVKMSRDKAKIDPSGPAKLKITKTSDQHGDRTISAGTVVNYNIIVTNDGGTAYDAKVIDTLTNPIGSVVNEQSWDLGDILPGERINLTYEIVYDVNTPTGEYQNKAALVAYKNDNDPTSKLTVAPAVYTLTINGRDLAVGNVTVIGTYRLRDGTSAAILSWETNRPTDGQVFFSKATGVSPFNQNALTNYGYARSSYYLPSHTTRHFVLLTNLTLGTQYTYRIRAKNDTAVAFGGDYTFTTPGSAPAPVVQQPAPVQKTVAQAPAPKPVPQPDPAPTTTTTNFSWANPAPKPEPLTTSTPGSFVANAVQTVTGFFGF